jgi:integrase/recombinase XerD
MIFEISLSKACEGVILTKTAAGLSKQTIASYRNAYRILLIHFNPDTPFNTITHTDLTKFFVWLNDYTSPPAGIAPSSPKPLGDCSKFNIYSACSVLWRWGFDEGYIPANIVTRVPRPKLSDKVIETLTREEVERILAACDRTAITQLCSKSTARHTAIRDKTIILTLLSTGVRASELCDICLADINLTNNSIKVLGKGNKERFVFFGKRTAKYIWRLSTARVNAGATETDLLFTVGKEGDRMDRRVMRRLLNNIGQRAGIKNVYPHRFRHTFAINYLRNGGDLLTLQTILGHSSLEMVRRYARVAASDCELVHERADPVDNWKL